MAATDWIDAVVSCADAAVSATDADRLAALADTCSTDAAISFIDDTSPSADAVDRLGLPGGCRRATRPSRSSRSTVSSRLRPCVSAPSATSSAMRAMAVADCGDLIGARPNRAARVEAVSRPAAVPVRSAVRAFARASKPCPFSRFRPRRAAPRNSAIGRAAARESADPSATRCPAT